MAEGTDPHAIDLRQRVALMRELGVAEWDPSTGRIVLGKEPTENPVFPATDDADETEQRRRYYARLLHREVSREEVERHLP